MHSASSPTTPLAHAGPRDSRRPLRQADEQAADCILCGATTRELVFSDCFEWLVRCCGCNLQFADPQPHEDELEAIYSADYFSTFGYSAADGGIYTRMKIVRADRLLETAERYLSPGRLLDVGSAMGECLLAASRRGWDVTGIERNPHAVMQAEEVVPGATECTSIDDYDGPLGRFDLITCNDVLEHVRRPDLALQKLCACLRPGGILLLTTIDRDSAAALLLGRNWFHIHRDHLWYFNRTSLLQFCTGAGFEPVQIGRARKTFNLNYILEVLKHSPRSPALHRLSKAGLRCVPRRLKAGLFSLPEGLLLIARRPG